MNIITRCARVPSMLREMPWRQIVALGLVASAMGYFFLGWSTSQRLAAATTQAEASRFLNEQARNNPSLADDLARLRMSHGDLAVASKLKMDADMTERKLDVPPLAEQVARGEPVHEVTLIGLAVTTGLKVDDPAFEEFLLTYDQALRLMPDPVARTHILSWLEEVAQSPEDWQVVREGFDALLVWYATREDPRLWEFYKAEHDWLAEPLIECAMLEAMALDETLVLEESAASDARVRALLSAVESHRDLVKQVYDAMPDELALVLHVFEGYGDVLELTQERYSLPLIETIEVIYANPAGLELFVEGMAAQNARVERQAALLDAIYKSNSNIWKHARNTPLALQLFLDVPTSADKILDRYGDNLGFLLQFYEAYRDPDYSGFESGQSDPVFSNAAGALVKYEDLAAITLYEYRDNPYFREALGNSEINTRIVPFVARFPDKLVDASKDPGWVNKHFDKEGRAIDNERWWEALPGGGIAKVTKNYFSGYPCEWSELGWAAFDVVDVGLIVFTVGTSKVITGSTKAGIKSTGRGVGRTLGRTTKIQAKGKRVLSVFGDTISHADDAARVSRSTAKPSMLKSLGQRIRRVGRSVESRTDDLADRVGRLGQVEHVNKWKSLGIALVLIKMLIRKDTLAKAPEQIGEMLASLTSAAVQVPGKVLAGAVRDLSKQAGLTLPSPILHFLIVAGLIVAALFSWSILRPKHVNQI